MHASQHFRDAPRLRGAAAPVVGRFGVEDFADRSDAGVAEVGFEAVEKMESAVVVAGMHFQPGIDERSDEPGPHRSLVVRRIARPQIAVVRRLVVGMVLGQRPQAEGREQLVSHDLDDTLPSRFVEDRIIERDREDLVRPEGGIVGIDDIVEMLT